MNQWERPSPDSGSLAGSHLQADLAALLSPLLLTGSPHSSLWEQWYEQASPAQRQQALARVGEQGVLFSHQLPAPEGPCIAGSRRSLLTALLHGPAPELEPVRPGAVQPIDGDLDEIQRQAVASALATPDLALILGYPGAGKSRVAVEILRQSVAAGQRVLFLAPTGAALDCVLVRLAGDSDVGVVRRLARDESLDGLAPCIARLTIEQRLRTFEEQTLTAACAAVEGGASAVEACRRCEPAWGSLEECLHRQEELHECIRAVEEQRTGLAAALTAEMDCDADSPLRRAWQTACEASAAEGEQTNARIQEIQIELERLTAEQKQRDAERQELAPLAEAKHGQRWWTGAWWRATLHGSRLQRLEQLQAEAHEADQRMQALQTAEQGLLADRARRQASLAEQRQALLAAEHSRRDANLVAQRAALDAQREEAAHTWQKLLSQESVAAHSSGSPREVLEATRRTWVLKRQQAEQELALRQQWLQALRQTLPSLPAHLAGSARIVAATTSALPADPVFGDRAAVQPFDLLVVEEAQRLSDAELLAASRRARRWVLIGEMPAELPAPPSPTRRAGPPRSQPVQPRPAFQRLPEAEQARPVRPAATGPVLFPGPSRRAPGSRPARRPLGPVANHGWKIDRQPPSHRPRAGILDPARAGLRSAGNRTPDRCSSAPGSANRRGCVSCRDSPRGGQGVHLSRAARIVRAVVRAGASLV